MTIEELRCMHVFRIGHVVRHWQKLILVESPQVPLHVDFASNDDRLMIAAARAGKRYAPQSMGYSIDKSLTPASDAEMVAYLKGVIAPLKKSTFLQMVTHAT